MPRGRVLPEVAPSLGPPRAAEPLLRRGEVAHDGLEPHVDPLRFEPGDGNLDAPVQVPGHGAILQALLDPASREADIVVPPVVLPGCGPILQAGLERAESEEEMVRLPRRGRGPVGPAAGVLQIEGVQEPRAVVALVSPRAI